VCCIRGTLDVGPQCCPADMLCRSYVAAHTEEISKKCHQLIFDNHAWCNAVLERDDPVPHLHCDLLDRIEPGSFDYAQPFHQKLKGISASKLVCNPYCVPHRDNCILPEVGMDMSGLPCIDQSKGGAQAKREGKTGPIFMTHAKYHIKRKTKLLIIENVRDCQG
jgi:hypothetical protein